MGAAFHMKENKLVHTFMSSIMIHPGRDKSENVILWLRVYLELEDMEVIIIIIKEPPLADAEAI